MMMHAPFTTPVMLAKKSSWDMLGESEGLGTLRRFWFRCSIMMHGPLTLPVMAAKKNNLEIDVARNRSGR
jgi:hypothetical protein